MVISSNPYYDPEHAPPDSLGRSKVSRQSGHYSNHQCERPPLLSVREGEEGFRLDRSIPGDKSLSLYIKLAPFENNEDVAARWPGLQAVKE